MKTESGTLFIVATPIGNLQDISLRAIETLRKVAWIAAEDTRHSSYLLKHFNIATPMKSLHDHNEADRLSFIEDLLEKGKDIALISDAGTPLISDPGYTLIHHLVEKGFKVSPIPGSCAAVAALVGSGLPSDRFTFEGFLPAKSVARCAKLEICKIETATLIFYEAPHRLLDCLEDMIKILGTYRQAVIGRELTKAYESFQRGTLGELFDYFKQHEEQRRGEIVICVAGVEKKAVGETDARRILKILLKELPVKKAAALTAEITGLRKNELYQMAIVMPANNTALK
jgi:16S rRNA (cytidine1402-2'-O)-methyltransferase